MGPEDFIMRNAYGKKMLLKGLCLVLVVLLGMLGAAAMAAGANEADGSKIESVTLSWLTPDSTVTNAGQSYSDSDPDHLFIATDADDELFMKYQVDVSLSGQNDYAPGTVQITIPAQVWHPRKYTDDGNGGVQGEPDPSLLMGSLNLSVPEAPSQAGNFNWELVGDSYVLTNIKTLGATSKLMFQFTVRGMLPHEIVDMSGCDPITADCKVITAQGNTISLQSENSLTAHVDTVDRIPDSGAVKTGSLYTVYDQAIPLNFINNGIPNGFSGTGEYIFVKWEISVNHEGNQPFTLKMDDVLSDVFYMDSTGTPVPVTAKPIFLGSIPFDAAAYSYPDLTYQAVNEPAYDDHRHDLYTVTDHPLTLYFAYAKEDLPAATDGELRTYYFENTAEWEMTEADATATAPVQDERLVTRAKRTDTVTYTPVNKRFDGGVTIVEKYTEDGVSSTGDYPYSLDLLKAGRDAELRFQLRASNMSWDYTTPITWNETENRPKTEAELEQTEPDPSTYGQLGWSIRVTDDRTFFNGSQIPMGPDDSRVASVQIGAIEKFTYGPCPMYQIAWGSNGNGGYQQRWVLQGEDCYYEDASQPMPDIFFEIQLDGNDTWIPAGTAVWGTDGKGQLTFKDLGSGVTADPASGIMTFPENTTDFRYTLTSNLINGTYADHSTLAGIDLEVWPVFTVKPSPAVMEVVDQAMAAMTSPAVIFRNMVTMDRAGWIGKNNKGSEYELVNSDNAYANMTAARYSAYLTKEAVFDPTADDDVDNRTATVHYSTKLRELSNLDDLDTYLEAQRNGAIPPETAGVWYDLLPEGMNPVLETVRMDGKDRITTVYTVKNYNGSQRTLLVVESELTPDLRLTDDPGATPVVYDSHLLTFDAVISYDDIEEFGIEQKNYIAFESRTPDLVDGILGNVPGEQGAPDRPDRTLNRHTPDMPDDIKALMTGLNPASDPDAARFVYAYDLTRTDVNFSAISGVSKLVRDDLDGVWTQGLTDQKQVTVFEGHDYTYRLRISSAEETVTKDIFLFDSIENYHVPADGTKDPDHDHIEARKDWKGDWKGKGQWRGTLNSIDLGEFVEAGVAPKLYISIVPDLQFADSAPGASQAEKDALFSSGEYNVSDTKFWIPVQPDASGLWTVPPELKGKVTAFAADLTCKQDGTPFFLGSGEAAAVCLSMTAPDDDADENVWHAKGPYARSSADGPVDWEAAMDPANNMYAFNNTRLRCIQFEEGSTSDSTRTMIRNDYTRVGIIPEMIRVTKVWEDDSNHDNSRPDEILVTLKRKPVTQGAAAEVVKDASGNPMQVTLNEENQWTGLFNQIDIVDENGDPWQYQFEECLPGGTPLGNGYTLNWNKESTNAYTLINTRENEKVSVAGKKIWKNDESRLDKRPDRITLELYQDGVLADTVTVTPDLKANWEYSFGLWDKYKPYNAAKGVLEEHVYTVKEVPVNGYFCDPSDWTVLVNEYDPYGKLEIVKTVKEAIPTAANDNATFTFTVKLMKEQTAEEIALGKPSVPLDGAYDYHLEEKKGSDWVKVPGSEGSVSYNGTITLKDGQKAVIEKLPSGSAYWVDEEPVANYVLSGFDNTSGTVPARIAATASFENTYRAEGSIQFGAKKKLTGQVLRDHQFSFVLTDENGNTVATAYSGQPDNTQPGGPGNPITGTAEITFPKLKYTEADIGKTYTYTVKEVTPDPKAGGMTYDGTGYTVKVTVADNGDGTLKVTAADGTGEPLGDILFTNQYKAECEVELDLMKVLEGRTVKNAEFEFELYGCDKNGEQTTDVLATVKNDAKGKVVFTAGNTPSLAFDQDDLSLGYELTGNEDSIATWYFLVKEKEGTDPTVDYTDEQKIFTVKLFDKRDGTLGYTVGTQKIIAGEKIPCEDCDGLGKVFKSDWITCITVGKTAMGEVLDPAIFTPNTVINPVPTDDTKPYLKAPLASSIDYRAHGTYLEDDLFYDLRCPVCAGMGVTGNLENLSQLVVNPDGSLSNGDALGIHICSQCLGSGFDTAKTYDKVSGGSAPWGYETLFFPVYLKEYVTPFVVGVNGLGGKDNRMTVEVLQIAGYWRKGGNSTYVTADDCTHCYGEGGFDQPPKITGDNELPVLTNTLKPGTLYLTKQLVGENTDPATEFEFTVKVTGDPATVAYESSIEGRGQTVPVTDGEFTVSLLENETLTFTSVMPGTGYEIAETVPGGWSIVEKVQDKGTVTNSDPSAVVFVNTLGSATGELNVSKTITGATAKAAGQEFSFEITLLDRHYQPVQGTYSGVVFDTRGKATITVGGNGLKTISNIPKGTSYTVRELGDLPGWELTAMTGETGEMVRSAAGAQFTNEYKASGIANISVSKTLRGRELKDGEFTFGLYEADEDGNILDPMPLQTVTNSAPDGENIGTVAFVPVTRDTETTCWYVVQEIVPAAADQDPAVGYSDEKILVTVSFTDQEGKGKLTADVKNSNLSGGEDSLITNTVKPGKLTLTKAVDGTLTDIAKMASFEMKVTFTDRDGKPWTGEGQIRDDKGNAWSAEDGSFVVPVTAGGSVTLVDIPNGSGYSVQEIPGTLPGWSYDQSIYTGSVKSCLTDDDIVKVTVTNPYEPTGEFEPIVTKVLNGATLTSGQFSFSLMDENGKVLEKVTNDSLGNVTFKKMRFTLQDVGTHVYQITEAETDEAGYQTDTAVRTLTVTVKEDSSTADGLLVTSVLEAPGVTTPKTFTNTYSALGEIPVTKIWIGDTGHTDQRDAITLTLWAVDQNGKKTQATVGGGSQTDSVPNPWVIDQATARKNDTLSGCWYGVPLFDPDGNEYAFMVEETGATDAYAGFVSGNGMKDFTAYNRLVSGSIPLSAVKTVDGKEPEEDEVFSFVLKDDQGTPVETVKNQKGEIEFTDFFFTGADVGTHVYTVTELASGTPDYQMDETVYTVTVTVTEKVDGTLEIDKAVTAVDPDGNKTLLDPDDEMVFANMKTISITVYKEWQGGEEDEITLILYANGKKVDKGSYRLTRDGYTYTFSLLAPMDRKGEPIEYSVKEQGISGYMRIYNNVGTHKKDTNVLYDGGTVINRAVTSIRVRKVWDGFDEKDPKPPITLTLYRDGEVYSKKPSGPDKDGWYTWSNLPPTHNGRDAVYYVIETPVEGMKTTYSNVAPYAGEDDRAYNGGTITNIGVPKTGDSEHPLLWILLGLAAAGAGTGIGLSLKKKKK